jgi:tetratricopeptide (TPR) repeat protein
MASQFLRSIRTICRTHLRRQKVIPIPRFEHISLSLPHVFARRVDRTRDNHSGGPSIRLAVVIAVALLLPALVWSLLNQAPRSGDESQYARASLDLYRTLLRSPVDWMYRLLHVFPSKPNGLIWVGQFFVPLGFLIGSVDKGLLLSVWITQVLTIVVVYRTVLALTETDSAVAALGCLILASAPLFFNLGTYYMVESVQMLSAAWFVLIMVRAGSVDPATTIGRLLTATAFATMTKATAPLFCIWPGLAAVMMVIRHPSTPSTWRWRQASISLIGGLCLLSMSAAWYYNNWAWVASHVRAASTGPVAAIWGKEDTFLHTLSFWLSEAGRSFFLVSFLGPALALLLVVSAWSRSRSVGFDRAILVVVLQIATVLGVFSFSANREPRYLLPLLPYVTILICWSVHRIGRPILTGLALTTFATQLAATYAIGFGLLSGYHDAPIRPLVRDGQSARLLNSIVARTCRDPRPTRYPNVIAIDPGFRGDWLAPEPANYVAARDQAGRDGEVHCQYQYLGGSFFGSSASEAWDALVAGGVEYVVTLDPGVYPAPMKVYNQALNTANFQILWANLTNSELFAREGPLPEDSGIVVFRRTTPDERQQRTLIFQRGDHPDRIAVGRALSDQGRHQQAVDELNRATASNPTNVEAWANLALAYERLGNMDQALDAGDRARRLSPNHYYVNLGLARVLYRQQKWNDAADRAGDAALHAPGEQERMSALAIAGLSAFAAGDSKRGCDFLRGVGGLQSGPEIAKAKARNGCER